MQQRLSLSTLTTGLLSVKFLQVDDLKKAVIDHRVTAEELATRTTTRQPPHGAVADVA
jgi:hypothetical protein